MERHYTTRISEHLIYHVFFPPKLPQEACDDDLEQDINTQLINSILETISIYQLNELQRQEQWGRMRKMLESVAHHVGVPFEAEKLREELAELQVGDALVLHIRAQNAAVLVRKTTTVTAFEVFEVQPPNSDVMSTSGKLVRAYPGPAVEVPQATIDEPGCLDQIASILAQMDREKLEGSTATTSKAGSQVVEVRDSAHPHFISQFFLGFLRGIGKAIEPRRVVKRIADEVLWNKAYKPWRRSPLWLIIRVALQTTLDSAIDYKLLMLFFEARLLCYALEQGTFSSDLLFAMRVKMARRLYKIQASVSVFVLDAVKDAADKTEEILQGRWTAIQLSQTKLPPQIPSADTFKESTYQSLPSSRSYLEQIFQGRSDVSKPSSFSPNHPTRLPAQNFSAFSNGAITSAFDVDRYVALFDFELAVHKHLPAWTSNRLRDQSACTVIASCMTQYTSAARSYYTQDISDQSIMVLTIMELWVSLDQLTTAQCPLLLDYSPEIPETVIESLLLRTALHVARAGAVQRYLRGRHTTAQAAGKPSIFLDNATEDSLAVRHFRQSPDQQKLKESIEHIAHLKRNQKLDEMNKQNNEYDRRVRRASRLEHNVKTRKNELFHDKVNCEKCRYEKETSSMSIRIYEWPLPADQLQVESTVFELACPEAFAIWRDETYGILCDLGGLDGGEGITPHYVLTGKDIRGHWRTETGSFTHRITIASSTKSFTQSHYSTTAIPAKEKDVCVNSGLSFRLFDTSKTWWATGPFSAADFAKYGTMKLPANSPYNHLRYALEGTNYNSNQAISDQSSCPKDLSLLEHLAFGTLRSGPRLQWMNMARELEENSLTFNRDEVNLLYTQAAWQLGPLAGESLSRDWHLELESSSYGELLVAQTTNLLNRVEENWREATSVRTIIMLVVRLITTTQDRSIHQAACVFLRKARNVALKWLDQLSAKLQLAEAGPQVLDYQHRVCEVALICRSTFDVDPEHLSAVLSTPEDFCNLVICSVAVHDNRPTQLDKAPLGLQILICRDRRLAHSTAPVVLRQLRQVPRLLSRAISRLWPSHQGGLAEWDKPPATNSRWISTTTTGVGRRMPQKIHINLLEGDFLIDGKPLGRLPQEYVNHPSYTRLFDQKVLDVVPANSPGMEFTTRFPIEGYQVSFALDQYNGTLIIQATKSGATHELIPHTILADDFPAFFSSDFHHWANLKTRIVEFRPLSEPWTSSKTAWRLKFLRDRPSTMVLPEHGCTSFLVDINSPLFESIAHRLVPLESSSYLHIMYSMDQGVSIELPRMKLSFFINDEADLESDNLRDQVVDKDQFSGTMIGFRNQLLLRSKNSILHAHTRSRTVLVPHGNVDFSSQDNHVSVKILANPNRQVMFHQYEIDLDLRCLTTTTGLTSRLFKIYLHALTSHCIPDPLTGRTGTEEALYELSESATSSFDQIDKDQAQLLRLIGSLTPAREYYPVHLRSMQTTHWANISPLSQHYAYSTATESILRRADALRLFHSLDFKPMTYAAARDKTLLERSASRTHTYYPANTTAHLPTVMDGRDQNDFQYTSRDSRPAGRTFNRSAASQASSLALRRWKQPTYATCDLVSMFESWVNVQGPSDDLSLEYSSDWLDLNLRSSWLSIYNLCRRARITGTPYALGACLASAAYSGKVSENLVQVLIAFSTNPEFGNLKPPSHSFYWLTDGYNPDSSQVEKIVQSAARDLAPSPAGKLSRNQNETVDDYKQRQRTHYEEQISDLAPRLTKDLVDQWPHTRPQISGVYSSWFEVKGCLEAVHRYFISCSRNTQLRNHLQQLEKALTSLPPSSSIRLDKMTDIPADRQANDRPVLGSFENLSLRNLMGTRSSPGSEGLTQESDTCFSVVNDPETCADTSRLAALLSEFQNRPANPLHNHYGTGLEQSRAELVASNGIKVSGQLPAHEVLTQNRQRRQEFLQQCYEDICSSLGPLTPVEHVISAAGIWPCHTPRALLHRLTLRTRANLPQAWYTTLKRYAQLLLEYQRAKSLVCLAQEDRREEFFKELGPEGGDTQADTCDPDWLLVQIQNNFRVRSVQSEVAAEMISPSSGTSTVLQLNMGEGKSSVVVPIVAATLANGRRLVRVVVLKPLWRQMFQLLVSRLAGLAGRRIYYLPFGRHIHLGDAQAQQIQDMYDECIREGGILLVQPEHILSFRLMGVDRLISSSTPQDVAISQRLRTMQDWLTANSRDILDESDEILHVRYQLVYTVGQQQPLEDHPDRWTTTQQIFPLVSRHISFLKAQFPDAFEHEPALGGQFPFIRIMPDSEDAVERLLLAVAQDALDGRVPNLNFVRLSPGVRGMALRFLTKKDFPEHDYQLLKDGCGSSLWNGLLLLRGLLACGILDFVLKNKHYRVDYGLDHSRSLLAVPYHAKDIPSLRAEFGHPDVTVALTCLSYYYQGLTDSQIYSCFDLLYKLDDPAVEYEQWVRRDDAISQGLRHLNGVNIKDREQFTEEIVPTFYRNTAVVDFFLSSVVFPKEAKAFPQKLATSGWDLAEVKDHVTTGFSGTNDNQYLLPTSIKQDDPVKQSSTNALVLTYLLQAENNNYICTRGKDGEKCTAMEFLEELVELKPEIRVLLDVGAQMLELRNEELIQFWLRLRPDVSAGVFFNNKDELVVLAQNGSPVPLVSSPFSQQLDKCVVYLDDGHTRGTDLSLPKDARAAVTLGPKVTKDRLLQGCMRMRKLGHGQSVVFCAPSEIDSQIRKEASLGPKDRIDALDIIRWAMLETCKDLQHHISHWAQQGVEYHRRSKALKKYTGTNDMSLLKKGWVTLESRPLEDMYGASSIPKSSPSAFAKTVFEYSTLRDRLQSLGIQDLQDQSMDEEQEREVSHEVERERQVERPKKSQPINPTLHPAVRSFIETGVVPDNSPCFVSLFYPLRSHKLQTPSAWSSNLLATVDFSTTISNLARTKLNDCMRPVNWIVSGPNEVLVALSPYEANELLPLIRASKTVRLHVYAPRVTQSMRSFSNLQFYTVPSAPDSNHLCPSTTTQLQLNLWAGQLYLNSYQEYRSLCAFLGIYASADNAHIEEVEVETDGFVKREGRVVLAKQFPEYDRCGFTRSPIVMVKDLMGFRRKGMDYMRTHLGQLLHARILNPEDF